MLIGGVENLYTLTWINMKRISEKKRRINARIGAIKKDKIERMGACLISKRWDMLQAAHIIRQSESIRLQDDPRNIILLNHYTHEKFDGGRFKDLYEAYPYKCKAIIERMRSLDPYYTNRFLRNNSMEDLIC